jgi:hypothetical protein
MSTEERDTATPEECVVERDDDPDTETSWSPWEAEIENVDLTPEPKVAAEDGMPTYPNPEPRSDIPALSPESLVCMGVFSEFVICNMWGDPVLRFKPEQVERAPRGLWRVSMDLARESLIGIGALRLTEKTHWSQVVESLGALGVCMSGSHGFWSTERYVQVQPIRPPCRHYIRQMSHADFNPENQAVYRLCGGRRTTEGAMMSVGNIGMWACTMREPPLAESEERIDKFDRMKVQQGKHRTFHSLVQSKSDDEQVAEQMVGKGIFGGG